MSETPPEGYEPDKYIWPILERLRDCLCDTLTERNLMPSGCFCGILPGDQVAWNYDSGMAWVRLTSTVPSAVFPAQSFELNNCGTTLAGEVEVGVLNCVPAMDSAGAPPTQEQMDEAARLQLATMSAVRAAILCCSEADDIDLILGSYTPQGPNGAMVGGTWTVSVGRI